MSSFNCFIISDQSGYPLQQLLGSGLAPSHEIPKVDWTCFIHHAKYSVHQNSQIACWTFRTVTVEKKLWVPSDGQVPIAMHTPS